MSEEMFDIPTQTKICRKMILQTYLGKDFRSENKKIVGTKCDQSNVKF